MRTARGRRLLTYGRGLGAERAALVWLMLKGYRPLARRFSAAGGEIDLVLRRGRTIVFCEVKARAGLEAALASLDEAKRRRVRRAAAAWKGRNAWAAALTFRADAVYLAPGEWPRHVPDAFPLD